jgi:hypothetical protein
MPQWHVFVSGVGRSDVFLQNKGRKTAVKQYMDIVLRVEST